MPNITSTFCFSSNSTAALAPFIIYTRLNPSRTDTHKSNRVHHGREIRRSTRTPSSTRIGSNLPCPADSRIERAIDQPILITWPLGASREQNCTHPYSGLDYFL